MITPADITALIELLRRTPMSGPESLYASNLLDRLAQLVTPEQPAAPTSPVEPDTSEPLTGL